MYICRQTKNAQKIRLPHMQMAFWLYSSFSRMKKISRITELTIPISLQRPWTNIYYGCRTKRIIVQHPKNNVYRHYLHFWNTLPVVKWMHLVHTTRFPRHRRQRFPERFFRVFLRKRLGFCWVLLKLKANQAAGMLHYWLCFMIPVQELRKYVTSWSVI